MKVKLKNGESSKNLENDVEYKVKAESFLFGIWFYLLEGKEDTLHNSSLFNVVGKAQ